MTDLRNWLIESIRNAPEEVKDRIIKEINELKEQHDNLQNL